MDAAAALLEQLEALITRFFSSARSAAAASRAPLDNRQRHGAVLVPGAECTRRRDEIQKESSFSQGPSADGTECQERRQCDPKGAFEGLHSPRQAAFRAHDGRQFFVPIPESMAIGDPQCNLLGKRRKE